jgi:hypothetical protein
MSATEASPRRLHADPEPELAEITIGWDEDTFCGGCLCALPAGAPAWADGDGQPLCADCAAA